MNLLRVSPVALSGFHHLQGDRSAIQFENRFPSLPLVRDMLLILCGSVTGIRQLEDRLNSSLYCNITSCPCSICCADTRPSGRGGIRRMQHGPNK
jgi:hypothetical protein